MPRIIKENYYSLLLVVLGTVIYVEQGKLVVKLLENIWEIGVVATL